MSRVQVDLGSHPFGAVLGKLADAVKYPVYVFTVNQAKPGIVIGQARRYAFLLYAHKWFRQHCKA